MLQGKRVATTPLDASRDYCRRQIERLAAPLKSLEQAPAYPVQFSPRLRTLAEQVDLETRSER